MLENASGGPGAKGSVVRAEPLEWADGLSYNSGMFSEVLVYHDDEAIYFEHRGKQSGTVRFSFEHLEALKIVEEEEFAASQVLP
jgi:hypothetical protein